MKFDFHELTNHLERVHSGRLALRQVSLCDAWPLYEATRNPQFNEFLLWPQPADEQPVLKRIESITQATRAGRMCAISAVIKKTGEWVSMFRFQPYAANPDLLEIGIWTHERYWQGKYSLEVVCACIDAAFSLAPIETLVGASFQGNDRSMRLMRAVGMTPTRLIVRDTEKQSMVELAEYQIGREQWRALNRTNSFSLAGGDVVSRAAEAAIAEQSAVHLSSVQVPSP